MNFEYSELDVEGMDTLSSIGVADNFNQWMYKTISPFCDRKILEVGSGVGNISKYFIENKDNIYVSDIRENYRTILKNNFSLADDQVLDLDIVHHNFDNVYAQLIGQFDSIFCLNVVEHIKDDKQAIDNMIKLLKPGGKLTVLVPAFQALYNDFDVALEHYRRYTLHTLSSIMLNRGKLVKRFYFNSLGILGWFISGKLMKNRIIPVGQMKIYNKIVPLVKLLDIILFRKVGLSVVCVIEKV